MTRTRPAAIADADVAAPDAVRRRSGWGAALAFTVGAVVVATDLALGRQATIIGLLAVVPALAGATSSAPWTTVLGGAALGAGAWVASYDAVLHRRDTQVILAGIAVATLVGAVAASVHGRRWRQLRDTRAVADVVQQALLRPLPGRVGDIGVASRCSSAARSALVGGDLFEAVETPYGVRVIVGDVRGKGLPAVRLASTVLGAFRQAAFEQADLRDLVDALDRGVARDASVEDFVTAVIVQVTPDGAAVANCAHPPPQLVSSGVVLPVEPPAAALPLGLGARPPVQPIGFGPGDRLLLYTDGVVEARRRGRFFDLPAELGRLTTADPDELVDRLYRRLVRFSRRRVGDDVVLLLLSRRPADPPPEDSSVLEGALG